MKTILDKIKDYKTQELEHTQRKVSLQDIKLKASDADAPLNFLQNFREQDINIIAEVKKASPSAGVIREDFDPVQIAQVYEDNGAKSLSVLTDENFFQGHLHFLQNIRNKVKLPLLRKDFTLAEYHILEGRAAGADAILLIVAMLDDYQLKDFHQMILELQMTPLVEVHDKSEYDRIQKFDLKLLGINNRNLKTFETNTKITTDLLQNVNYKKIPVISESGLKSRDILEDLKSQGVSGFLIGESLMREKDFGKKLRELIQ